MGKVLIRKDAAAAMTMGPTVQTNIGAAGSPFFIMPKDPIEPERAGMRAAMERLRGMRGVRPEQAQTVLDSATRGAERGTGLVQGKYGMPSLGMLGLAGLKNIYDASVQGRAPSLAGTFSSAYGMGQYAQPFAATIGAEMGARRGFRDARRQVADTRTASPTGFSIPEEADMDMFNIAPPTHYDSSQDSPLARAGLGDLNPSMMSGDARAYGRSGAPSMGIEQFRQVMPSFQQPTSPTPEPQGGMSQRLMSALPDPMQASMDQMKEQQEKREEEKKEREKTFNEQLSERMMGQRQSQTSGF